MGEGVEKKKGWKERRGGWSVLKRCMSRLGSGRDLKGNGGLIEALLSVLLGGGFTILTIDFGLFRHGKIRMEAMERFRHIIGEPRI